MRTKIIIVMAIALMSVSSSYALSPLKIGVKAGITSQSAKLDKSDILSDYRLSTENGIGTQFGVYARLNLLLFHIQPEFIYSMNRYKLTAVTDDNTISTSTVRQNSLDVPLLFGFKFLFLRVNAGPVFNLMTSGSTKSNGDVKHDVSYTKGAVSYAVGAGIDLGRVSVDARYNGQFTKSLQNIEISDLTDIGSLNSQYGNWAFTVGYSF